jgi:hypothetical protein
MEQGDEEMYTDSELGEEEEYSEEVIDEIETGGIFVPKTFEEFKSVYNAQFDHSDEPDESYSQEADVSSPEPQSVDVEMEKRVEQELLKLPGQPATQESSELETDDMLLSHEEEYEPEEDDLEEPEEDELDEPDDFSGEQVASRFNLPRLTFCRCQMKS